MISDHEKKNKSKIKSVNKEEQMKLPKKMPSISTLKSKTN